MKEKVVIWRDYVWTVRAAKSLGTTDLEQHLQYINKVIQLERDNDRFLQNLILGMKFVST